MRKHIAILFFISLWSSAGFARIPDEITGKCQKAVAKKYRKSSISQSEIPSLARLNFFEGQISRIFLLARKKWTTLSDRARVLILLERFRDSGRKAINGTDEKALKDLRKAGAALRSLYLCMAVTHQHPPALQGFLRDYGRLNDLILLGSDKKIKGEVGRLLDEQIKNQAESLFNALSADETPLELTEFVPAEKTSMREYFQGRFTEARKIIDGKKMTIAEFHQVRNDVRDIRNVYSMILLNPGEGDFGAIELYLTEFSNTLLGKINDDLFAEFLRWRGEKDMSTIFEDRKKYERRVTLKLDHGLVRRIGELMRDFEAALED